MNNVIDTLKEYSEGINLEERFSYDFTIDEDVFSATEVSLLQTTDNLFQRNVQLKWIMKDKYTHTQDQSVLDFWIVNEWGNIKGFKKNPRNQAKINNFKKHLNDSELTLDCFSTISSLSKISSFINPEEFAIYDSRVIFSLNWLMRECENSNRLKVKYFPIPSGRNRIISDFDMRTLIHISHMSEYRHKKELFLDKKTAYSRYCEFIRDATKIVYGPDSKPYELEMLLFVIADREIFKRITCTFGKEKNV